MYNKDEKISASEINKYCYCQYSWYYERLYGKKHIRESYKNPEKFKYKTNKSKAKKTNNKTTNAKNNKDDFKYKTIDNFKRGVKFHDDFLEQRRKRLIIKFIILFIILSFLTILFLWVLKLCNIL
nr:hypothetical protein [uncultured Tyzzerella sp.]